MEQPRPDVEKVTSGRRTPLAVGLIVIVIVGVLVWRPWHTEPRPAIAQPTTPVAASPTQTASQPTASPTPRPAPTAIPSVPPPDLGPAGPITEFALVQQPGRALVHCEYGPLRQGRRHLRSLVVEPPLVPPLDRGDSNDIRHVSWHVELQSNRLEWLFERDWRPAAASRSQQTGVSTSRPAQFTSLEIDYRAARDEETAIFRVLVVVEWRTRNLELAGRGEVIAPSYLQANDPVSEIHSEGCRAVRLAT
jgi:hypothetical protein